MSSPPSHGASRTDATEGRKAEAQSDPRSTRERKERHSQDPRGVHGRGRRSREEENWNGGNKCDFLIERETKVKNYFFGICHFRETAAQR